MPDERPALRTRRKLLRVFESADSALRLKQYSVHLTTNLSESHIRLVQLADVDRGGMFVIASSSALISDEAHGHPQLANRIWPSRRSWTLWDGPSVCRRV